MRRYCAVLVSFLAWVDISYAQQTIFNVPSGDVLDRGTLYFENDWYARSWETASGTTYVRGVAGVGHSVELGLNVGAFDLVHPNDPFIDFAVKWRPWQSGVFGFYLGNQAGIGIGGPDTGKGRDFVYGSILLKLPAVETRICGGAYFATSKVFGGDSRPGGLVTFEQPLPMVRGLTLAADWMSGDGAYLTPGLIYSRSPFTFYLGYGLANTGRKDDQITAEIGITQL